MEMEDKTFKLTVLGCRGSVPVSGKSSLLFGGATSSYRVDAGDEIIYLDAGSGIYTDRPEEGKRVSILLSHWHIDHLVGLGMFLQKNKLKADIYGPAEDDEKAAALLRFTAETGKTLPWETLLLIKRWPSSCRRWSGRPR